MRRHPCSARPAFVSRPTRLFVGLAIVSLVWQVFLYLKVFEIRGRQAILHFLISAILLTCLACGLSTFAAFPLRWWLE